MQVDKVKGVIPCCNQEVALKVLPMQDKQCPRCKHWWRADVSFIKQSGDKHFHSVEWTHIGTL